MGFQDKDDDFSDDVEVDGDASRCDTASPSVSVLGPCGWVQAEI